MLAASSASVVVRQWDQNRMPATVAAEEGNREIMARRRPRDAVRPWPLWFADARLGLGDMPILMSETIDEWEQHRHDRVWLAYSTSHARSLEMTLPAWLGERETVFDAAGYRVEAAAVTPPSPPVLWDGFDAVRDAVVSQRAPDGDERPCHRWLNQAWNCDRYDEWIHVAPVVRGMGDEQPYNCIAANAPANGMAWIIRWADVPSAGATLRWRAGLTFEAIRSSRGGPVTFRVFVDGALSAEQSFDPNDRSYATQSVDLPDAPTAQIRFEVEAQDFYDRFFCFRPQIVAAAGDDLGTEGSASSAR